jgi:hypothetical protein
MGVRDSCGKSASKGDTTGAKSAEGGTARGKRVPYVPINVKSNIIRFVYSQEPPFGGFFD